MTDMVVTGIYGRPILKVKDTTKNVKNNLLDSVNEVIIQAVGVWTFPSVVVCCSADRALFSWLDTPIPFTSG